MTSTSQTLTLTSQTLSASSIKTGRPYWDVFSPDLSTDDWQELEIEA